MSIKFLIYKKCEIVFKNNLKIPILKNKLFEEQGD